MATTIGGPIILGAGYGGLGLFTTAIGLCGAALALGSWLGGNTEKVIAPTTA